MSTVGEASATVQHAMGIPPEYFTTVFAAAPTTGWIAHIMSSTPTTG